LRHEFYQAFSADIDGDNRSFPVIRYSQIT
jgi:hypothetical protein